MGRRAFVGFFVVVVTIGPFTNLGLAAPGVPPCDVPGQITPHPVNWYTVRAPKFPSGAPGISEFAVEPLVPERLYVTNGSVVLRSSDSGCHWSESYSLPATGPGPTAADSRILEIEVSAPGVIYLPIQQKEPVSQPHVAVSKDAGQSWALADGPPLGAVTGEIRDFDASLGNGSAAAMLVDLEHDVDGVISVDSQQVLFFTDRAGAAWEPRELWDKGAVADAAGLGVTINAQPELGSISMNPLRPNEIWLYGEAGVFKTDSGSPLTPVALGQISALDVSLDGAAVYAYSKDGRTANFSLNSGENFEEYKTGFVVDSVDASTTTPIPFAALSGFGRVYYQTPKLGRLQPQTYDVTPLDGRAVSDVQVGVVESATITSIYGRSSHGIEVTYQPQGEPVRANSVTATLHEPPDPVGDNRLVPGSKEVVLRPGRSKTIPYDLNLPAATTPLDVYFLIDISGSMGGTINGVRSAMQDIADRLASSKIDARFGVGSFRAFGDAPAYERDRDIGPADQGLASALNGLNARGGGDETQMYALVESVRTGRGPGMSPPKNMHFRPGSLRVAILATDELISQGGRHPTIPATVDALRAQDVKMVGLAIQEPPLLGENDYDNPPEPAGTLMEVAEGSKAIAPVGGVDCDGDSEPEIDTGGAIVCMIAPDDADDAGLMAGAIVSVLEAVQDIQSLDVQVNPAVATASSADTVTAIEPELFAGVDLKEPSFHSFDVTVHCPQVSDKTVYPMEVSVLRRGGAVASAALTLVCKPFPVKEKKDPLPLVLPFFPIPAIFPPPPRPPDPIPEPNPNPQPNPQQNPQAQAGFVMQKQEQTQLALAYDHVREQSLARQMTSEQYSFTVERGSRIPPPGFIAAAAAMTMLFAYVMAVEKSKAVARAMNRKWP